MKVHCEVPHGTVLEWRFREDLPKSKIINDAFMHTFGLTADKVNVIVRMHAKVRGHSLSQTTKWRVAVVPGEDSILNLCLTPALPEARVTSQKLQLCKWESRERQFCVEFVEFPSIQEERRQAEAQRKSSLFSRRQKRAEVEASLY